MDAAWPIEDRWIRTIMVEAFSNTLTYDQVAFVANGHPSANGICMDQRAVVATDDTRLEVHLVAMVLLGVGNHLVNRRQQASRKAPFVKVQAPLARRSIENVLIQTCLKLFLSASETGR